MDRPLTISLGGSEMLSLAKGAIHSFIFETWQRRNESRLVYRGGSFEHDDPCVDYNATDLFSGATQYLVFEPVLRGPLAGSVFVPRQVMHDRVLDMVRVLSPVGMAVREPIQ
jgi:hypothetical protein